MGVGRVGDEPGLAAGEAVGRDAQVVQRHAEEGGGLALAGGDEHVHLTAGPGARHLRRQVQQVVGLLAHGADDHHDLVAVAPGAGDVVGHGPDAVRVGHATCPRTSARRGSSSNQPTRPRSGPRVARRPPRGFPYRARMPTDKRQRQKQGRVERLAAERVAAKRAARKRRVITSLVLAALTVGVLVVLSQLGSDDGDDQADEATTTTAPAEKPVVTVPEGEPPDRAAEHRPAPRRRRRGRDRVDGGGELRGGGLLHGQGVRHLLRQGAVPLRASERAGSSPGGTRASSA